MINSKITNATLQRSRFDQTVVKVWPPKEGQNSTMITFTISTPQYDDKPDKGNLYINCTRYETDPQKIQNLQNMGEGDIVTLEGVHTRKPSNKTDPQTGKKIFYDNFQVNQVFPISRGGGFQPQQAQNPQGQFNQGQGYQQPYQNNQQQFQQPQQQQFQQPQNPQGGFPAQGQNQPQQDDDLPF